MSRLPFTSNQSYSSILDYFTSRFAKFAAASVTIAAADSSAEDKHLADAICDGEDDDLEIQAALDALPSGGGEVKLTPGIFYCTTQISVKTSQRLIGSGPSTVLKLPDGHNHNGHGNIIEVSTRTDVILADFMLDGNRANGTGYVGAADTGASGLALVGSVGVRVLNVTAHSFSKDGFRIGANGLDVESEDVQFVNCLSYDNDRSGFTIAGNINTTFVSCIARDGIARVNGDGFHIEAGGATLVVQQLIFLGCIAENNEAQGFTLSDGEFQDIEYIGCIAHGNGDAGFQCNAATDDLPYWDGCVSFNNTVGNFKFLGAVSLTATSRRKVFKVPGGSVFDSTVTISGTELNLVSEGAVTFSGLLTISGANSSVKVGNGSSSVGIVISGAGALFDGGGLGTLVNGGILNHGISVTANKVTVRDTRAKTTAAGGNAFDALNNTGEDFFIERVVVDDSDRDGFRSSSGARVHCFDLKVLDCDEHNIRILVADAQIESCYVSANGSSGIRIEGNNALVRGNTSEHASSIVVASGSGVIVEGNRVSGSITDTPGTSIVRNNSGWVTENSGVATLANATTSIVVTHGLSVTPVAGDIMVTPIEPWGAMTEFYIDTYTATQFTIHADQNPAQDVDFAWKALVV